MKRRVCLIVNPTSAGGGTASRFAEIGRAADAAFTAWDLRKTEGPAHATELTRQAIAEGFDAVVGIGGDGTANEVINGFFVDGEPIETDACFSVVPAGTGCDLVKTLKMPRDLDAAFRIIAQRQGRPTDVLRARFVDHDGAEGVRMCINVLDFGMGGEVVARVNKGSKRMGGLLTFLGATVASVLTYRPVLVQLRWCDGEGTWHDWEGELLNCFLANAEYAGGGMWFGRGGSMQDGLVDVTVVPNLSVLRQLQSLPRLYTGTPERVRGIRRFQASQLEAKVVGGERVRIDVDGEQPGTLDASFEVLPRVVSVLAGW
ncbi:MAG: hypothetical protein KC912_25720 [Proteobacteria bacterium]|nr:hypothetical protein [Pseudomonadota bacterium]